MKEKLMLFVWTEFSPDYTDGLACAIAKDETEARELIKKAMGYEPYTWGTLEIHALTEHIAFAISGGG